MILRCYFLIATNIEHKFSNLFLVGIFALLACFNANGQQHVGYTQFSWDQSIVNPAYVGSKESVSARLFYRNQWAGFEGAPKTQSLSVHSPFNYGSFGAGLNVMHDQLGITDQLTATASFAYHMKLDQGKLAFGLSGEYRSLSMTWSALNPQDELDEFLPVADISTGIPNFGFGAYYYTSRFYAGASVPWLLEPSVDMESSGFSGLDVKRHAYVIAGYVFDIGKNIKVKPGAMVRIVENAPIQIDANISVLMNEAIWIGASYRVGDSGDLMIQYQINKQFAIGYSYDFTFSKIQNHLGSHEIFVGFDLQRKSDGYDHPRYF